MTQRAKVWLILIAACIAVWVAVIIYVLSWWGVRL